MIYEKLSQIQTEVNVPKTHENKFGGFKYRNAEDIYNAVKAVEEKFGVALTVSDKLVFNADRAYVEATARLSDIKDRDDYVEVTSAAEIHRDKKGMDASQTTGSASSYARKYALSGLFLLDDTVDPDKEAVGQQKVGRLIAESLHDRCKGDDGLEKFLLKAMGIKKWDDLINDHYYILNDLWHKYVKTYEESK